MKQGPRIAIDFGTTRTKVAYYDLERERAELIQLGMAQREIIPSVFYVPQVGSGRILVGDDVLAQVDVDLGGIVREIKREIDRNGRTRCGVGRLAHTRVEVLAEMLRMIRLRCEKTVLLGQAIQRCTLTVPVSFSESQRANLAEASNQAAFVDVRLVDEPTAAVRGLCEQQGQSIGIHILVVAVGGGTADFSVGKRSQNRFVPYAGVVIVGLNLGGNDIDDEGFGELHMRQSEKDKCRILKFKDSLLVKLWGLREQFPRSLTHQKIVTGKTVIEVDAEFFRNAEDAYLTWPGDGLKKLVEKYNSWRKESLLFPDN